MAGYIGSKSSVTLVDGITEEGGTLTGDLSFGDNNKAIFGAGSDANIRHDGANTKFSHTGSGGLYLGADTLALQNGAHNETYLSASVNGAVSLRYDNNIKLATTSTGIDITGTVTSDAYALDNVALPSAGTPTIFNRNTDNNLYIQTGSGNTLNVLDGSQNTMYQITPTSHIFQISNAEKMRIDSSGNVGIGTSSPDTELNIGFSGADDTNTIRVEGSNGASERYAFDIEADGENAKTNFKIGVGGGSTTTCMTLDSSGNLLVGKTATGIATVGAELKATGELLATVNNDACAFLNRKSSDGDIATFRKDGTTVGSIGTGYGGATQFGIKSHTGDVRFSAANSVVTWDGTQFYPAVSGSKKLGHPNHRWEDAWIVNGVTTGSDANDKQDIATLTATEMLVAARLSQTFRTYRWKDKVVEKGDNARTHTGTIAQEVQAAFTAEGLDAGDYAMFMSDTRWEHDVEVPAVEAVEAVEAVTETTTDENGNEVVTVITEAVEAVEAKDAYTRTDTYDTEAEAPEGATSKTRMGIRYPELLSFVAAYNEQRFASIEARLTALEA